MSGPTVVFLYVIYKQLRGSPSAVLTLQAGAVIPSVTFLKDYNGLLQVFVQRGVWCG